MEAISETAVIVVHMLTLTNWTREVYSWVYMDKSERCINKIIIALLVLDTDLKCESHLYEQSFVITLQCT